MIKTIATSAIIALALGLYYHALKSSIEANSHKTYFASEVHRKCLTGAKISEYRINNGLYVRCYGHDGWHRVK